MTRGQKNYLALAGAALAGGAAVYVWQKHQAATTAGALPPAPAPVPLAQGVVDMNGGVTITLQPGIQTLSQALDVNTIVILYLPAGGKWVSRDGAGITDPVSPQAFVFNGGPISHTFVWTDSSNTTQTTTLYLTVAPTVPSVTT